MQETCGPGSPPADFIPPPSPAPLLISQVFQLLWPGSPTPGLQGSGKVVVLSNNGLPEGKSLHPLVQPNEGQIFSVLCWGTL